MQWLSESVLGCSLQGDWGTQFGMLIQHIDESREGGLAGTSVEEVSDLQKLYKDSKKRFDNDAMFKTKAREAVKQLQGGNPLYVQASTNCSLQFSCIHEPLAFSRASLQLVPLHGCFGLFESEQY